MKLKDPKKEQKIIEATLNIVHTKGLLGVKMSEVAKRVNISPSNLYVYFGNKEDLLLSVFFSKAEEVTQYVSQRIPAEPDFKKRFYSLFLLIIDVKMTKKKAFSFCYQFIHSPYYKKDFINRIDVLLKDIFDILRDGQKEKILKPGIDVNLMFATIEGATTVLTDFHDKGRIILDQESIDHSFNMIWDAVRN